MASAEGRILDAIDHGHAAIREIIAAQRRLREAAGKAKPQWSAPTSPWPTEFAEDLRRRYAAPLDEAMRVKGKMEQYAAIDRVRDEAMAGFGDDEAEKRSWTKKIMHDMVAEQFRSAVLDKNERLDGRAFDEIRQVTCEVGLLPRTHGSALFTRGETQALVTCTLGTSDDVQIIEALEGESRENFLLHYNFPPYSVGEVKFLRGPGRREIGHGNLARRALKPVIPAKDAFPYTLRVVSDILESNGSSSMATVCGGTLSLMDAGVPITAPVAGIAMGLVSDGKRHAVLTDIAGQEDHYGDMDFKVAGTREGITALQMDIKISGLSREVMEQALEQARKARLQLLDIMEATIAAPRSDISKYAPRIITMIHPPGQDPRRHRTGWARQSAPSASRPAPRSTSRTTAGSRSPPPTASPLARRCRSSRVSPARSQVGEIYDGTVRRVEPYGAFVEILPNQDGLLHVSEMGPRTHARGRPTWSSLATRSRSRSSGSTPTTASSCRAARCCHRQKAARPARARSARATTDLVVTIARDATIGTTAAHAATTSRSSKQVTSRGRPPGRPLLFLIPSAQTGHLSLG